MALPQEYQDYLDKNLNLFERMSDGLTSFDERINYVVEQLHQITGGILQDDIRNLRDSVDTLAAILSTQGVLMTGKTRQIRFQETLLELTGNIFYERCEWDAILTSVTMHFPPGCNALVDVAVGIATEHLFPKEGYIALDNATPVFPTYEMVRKGEEFWVDIANGDAGNEHTISVILTLQEKV